MNTTEKDTNQVVHGIACVIQWAIVAIFIAFILTIFIPSQHAIPKVSQLRNQTMMMNFEGNRATLRNIGVNGSPVILTAQAYQKSDNVIQLVDDSGATAELKLQVDNDSPLSYYAWNNNGNTIKLYLESSIQYQQKLQEWIKERERVAKAQQQIAPRPTNFQYMMALFQREYLFN